MIDDNDQSIIGIDLTNEPPIDASDTLIVDTTVKPDYMYVFHLNTQEKFHNWNMLLKDLEDVPGTVNLEGYVAVSYPVVPVVMVFHQHLGDADLAQVQALIQIDAERRGLKVANVELIHAAQVQPKPIA